LNGCLSDVGIIIFAVLPDGCVNDKVYFLVVDSIHNIRPSFVNLFDEGGVDPVAAQELVGIISGQYAKANALEKFCHRQYPFLVLLLHGDKYSATGGELLACPLLRFEKSQFERVGHAENLSG